MSTYYAAAQLEKAVASVESDGKNPTAAALQRVKTWIQVLQSMESGEVRVGDRKVMRDFPSWVTPVVTKGGFATGNLAAGGELADHELNLVNRENLTASRSALAQYHLSDKGLERLQRILESGQYKVNVPEEAAFPVLAWLLREQDYESAVLLLDSIHPYLSKLRFDPPPHHSRTTTEAHHTTRQQQQQAESLIDTFPFCKQSAATLITNLKRTKDNLLLEKQWEATVVWQPFYDDVLRIWLEVLTPEGALTAAPFPKSWQGKASQMVARYHILSVAHSLCTKHKSPDENCAVLLSSLTHIVAHGSLSPGQMRRVCARIASMLAKRGHPDDTEFQARRTLHAQCVRKPPTSAVAKLLVQRVQSLGASQDRGIPASHMPTLLEPVHASEVSSSPSKSPLGFFVRAHVPEGTVVASSIVKRIKKSLEAPLPELLKAGVVGSMEDMAPLLSPLTAAITSQQYEDPVLARLMADLEQAFLNRRSLLLLNLQSQIRISELPWHAAVAKHASPKRSALAAKVALCRVAEEALQAFPSTMLPNRFIRELTVLSKLARESTCNDELPFGVKDGQQEVTRSSPHSAAPAFLEELAADIFMGKFSPKFTVAALHAAQVMKGSMYERYYGLNYSSIAEDLKPKESQQGGCVEMPNALSGSCAPRISCALHSLCVDLAKKGGLQETGGYVAYQGGLIEQAQIITTHNLAALVEWGVEVPWGDLSIQCMRDIGRMVALGNSSIPWRQRMSWLKSAAFAWRNMVFFLSMEKDVSKKWQALDVGRSFKSCIVTKILDKHLLRLEAALKTSPGEWETAAEAHVPPVLGWACGSPHSLKHPEIDLHGSNLH